jgi:hypothetical protein
MDSRIPIDAFFQAASYAVIGVSADRKKFGNTVFRTMRGAGLTVYPVHPLLETVEGDRVYHTVEELPDGVTAVVTVVPPAQTERVVQSCARRGVRSIWMQPGSSSKAAVEAATAAGLNVVEGRCILMFTEPVTSVHRIHRWFTKLVGAYPR